MKVKQLEQGSPEWLAYRKNGVGSSDIPSICGIEGAYKTRKQVLREKLGEVEKISNFTKELFQSGHEWEAVVRDFINAQGKEFKPAVVESDENKRFYASLDGVNFEHEEILEIKYTTKLEMFENLKSGKVEPIHYAQIQWQLFCTGFAKATLCVVHEGNLVSFEVKREESTINALTAAAELFLQELDAESVKEFTYLESPKFLKLVQLKLTESQMSAQLDAVQDEIKALSKELLTEYEATTMEGAGIRVEVCERVGAVDYSKIPELKGVNLEQYRKKPTTYTQVKLLKGNN